MPFVFRLFICSLIALYGCSTLTEKPSGSGHDTLGDQYLVIQGPAPKLDLQVDGRSVFEVIPANGSEKDRVEAIFRFMSEEYTPWNADVTIPESALFYGYGFGMCGEQSRIMARLWFEHGVKSRVVSLPRHVMAEAEVDGVWQLFDAQHRMDFSSFLNQPVSLATIREKPDVLPEGIDPIGVTWEHMLEVYLADGNEPNYGLIGHGSTVPVLDLTAQQQLMIRPRPTGTHYPLRLLEPNERPRLDNLLPFYELVLTHRFDDDSMAELLTWLPILDVRFEDGQPERLHKDRAEEVNLVDPQVESYGAILAGHSGKLLAQMPAGGTMHVTYALAGWVGNRLFSSDTGVRYHTTGQRDREPQAWRNDPSRPEISLKNITLPDADEIAFRQTVPVQVTLQWERLTSSTPLMFELIMDEMVSDLPLQNMRLVDRVVFAWDPQLHGRDGETEITLNWKVVPYYGYYRPHYYRSFVIQVVGPHVTAGKNFQVRRIRIPDQGPKKAL